MSNIVKILLNVESLKLSKLDVNKIEQRKFYSNVGFIFNIFVDSEVYNLLEKIAKRGKQLEEFCLDIIEGIVAHKYLITTDKDLPNTFPLLEGKNIKKYHIIPPKKRIIWDLKKIHRARGQYIWEADKKLLFSVLVAETLQ